MGPSLATREPRRSSRRPASTPATRSSTSPPRSSIPAPFNSPHTPTTPLPNLPTLSHKRSNSSSKRVKLEQDDFRSPMDDATIPTANGRTKRRSKDKPEVVIPPPAAPDPPIQGTLMPDVQDDNDDDGGITRCVCGRVETDGEEDELGFMVQCETCKAWQHGICVNLRQEDANDLDYYCEQCRPDLHVDLLKSLKKRARHTNNSSQRHSASVPRSSRSHSPGHVLTASAAAPKAPKRRNTMNSRDAAYEDALKQLIESTRPDAEKDPDAHTDKDDHGQQLKEPGIIIEIVSGARKKRKRATVDKENTHALNSESGETPAVPKRNRSNSSTPDRPIASTLSQRDTAVNGTTTTNGASAPARYASTSSGTGAKLSATTNSSKSKRGRKDVAASGDPPDTASSKKHPNQYTYRKPAAQNGGANASVHDHGTRRNAHAPHLHAPAAPQPLLTSWGLPDYLAHLASALPSEVPRPVEVRVLEVPEGEGEVPLEERVQERGVKVKWPAKRTGVGDMNKRVRGIIDWVGREQAIALERQRRREALRRGCEAQMKQAQSQNVQVDDLTENVDSRPEPLGSMPKTVTGTGTIHLMEELMKELIAFQEKFGPGAKGKEQRRGAGG